MILRLLFSLLLLAGSLKAACDCGDPDLLACFGFQNARTESCGTTAYDLVDNGTTPYNSGSLCGGQTYMAGAFSNTNYFNGTSAFRTAFSGVTSYTVKFYLYLTSAPVFDCITVYSNGTTEVGFDFSTNGANPAALSFRKKPGGPGISTGSILSVGTCYYIRGTLSSTDQGTLYVNESQVSTGTVAAAATGLTVFRIGTDTGSPLSHGYISDFTVLDAAQAPPTPTPTPTITPTFTITQSWTSSPTITPTYTVSPTPTWTPTATKTSTPTWTPTASPTKTNTPVASATNSPTPTWTRTATRTRTATPTSSPTPTITRTAVCVSLGQSVQLQRTQAMSGLCFYKFVTASSSGSFGSVAVRIDSGSGSLQAGIYSMLSVNYGMRVDASAAQTARQGLNVIPLNSVSVSAGNYALAIEGSGTLKIRGTEKGTDRQKRAAFGTFNSFTTMDPLGWSLEIYSSFCQ